MKRSVQNWWADNYFRVPKLGRSVIWNMIFAARTFSAPALRGPWHSSHKSKLQWDSLTYRQTGSPERPFRYFCDSYFNKSITSDWIHWFLNFLVFVFPFLSFLPLLCVSGEAILSQSKSFCFIDPANESGNDQFPQKSHKKIWSNNLSFSWGWMEDPLLRKVKHSIAQILVGLKITKNVYFMG